MRYVLNALIAKKSGAGGFQIACNFARAALNDAKIDWHLVVSQDLGDFIRAEFEPGIFESRVHLFPVQPNRKSYFTVRKQLKELIKNLKPDVVYSILAPSYFSFDCPEVMRCCNAWDIIPSSHIAYSIVSKKYALRMRLKSRVIVHLMRSTKYFITQTEEAKKGICRVAKTASHNVCVVPNVLNKTFSNAPKSIFPHQGFNIAMVGAPASHKNITILPKVAKILKEKYKCTDVKFLTTLFEEDPYTKKVLQDFNALGVTDMICNRGRQSQLQLIDLYRTSDMAFFPSLLETFSATLLEYMCFGLPTVISDMPFNTEVMGDAALRYSPLSADDAAEKIYSLYKNSQLQEDLRKKGNKQLVKYSSFENYYNNTLRFLTEVAQKNCKS